MADETKIIRIVIDASRAVDGSRAATAAWERMERAQASAVGSMDRMEVALGRVGGFLKAQIALQVAEIGSRFLAMAKASLDAAAGLGELADQMGITTQGLQALQFSAVQNGVKLEQLETGIAKFSQKMGEAADGSKDMIEALDRIGVKILDARGQLRPTEVLLGDVARAITSIDEPAKQTAAAVDFFGKAGAKMIPTLRDMASGMDAMQARAKAAGAVISDDTIAKLDALADRSSVAALRWRALIAEVVAPVATEGLERINTMLGEIISQLERGRASGKGFWETVLNDSRTSGRIGSGPNALRLATPEELAEIRRQNLQKELAANADDPVRRQMVQDDLDRLNRKSMIDRQAEADSQETWARRFKPAEVTAPGVSNPGIKGAGQSEADAIAKARRDAIRDRDAQLEYAEASEKGARAVADLETHFKALKAAQDAYGKTADDNKAGVAALTAELERLMSAADKARNLKDFNLGTTELEKSNELLEAENRLINASIEDRARELALIRTRQEITAKGLTENDEAEKKAIDRRNAAIEQNERLKAQGDELKKANELWTAPLKSALESIQQTGADMWEKLLENGRFSAEEFGQVFAKMARRAAAELLALATIRPVISVAVGGLGSLGLVSPATASSLGYGSGSGSLLGGGLGSFGGSGSSWMGSFGDWLNTPFTGPYAGLSPSSMQGVPMLSGASGLTPLGLIGGLGSIGMGAYGLATSRSTGGTVSGLAGILGGGMSLAASAGLIGSAFGPIGMGIGLLGGLLGGLFGGEQPQTPPISGANATWVWNAARGSYSMSGSTLNGGQPITGQYRAAATSMADLYTQAGGIARPDQVWGVSVWNNERDKTGASYVIDPSGNSRQWGMGSNEQDIGVSTAMGHAAFNTLMNAVNLSPRMRQGLSAVGDPNGPAPTFEEVAKAAAELKTLDDALSNLGKTTNTAEQALAAIDNQFSSLYATAARYGLGSSELDSAKAAQRLKVGTDFADAISRQLMGDKEGALFDLDKEKKSLVETNETLKSVVGYIDQTAKIEELYAKKRADIIEQYAKSSTAALATSYQALIDRLTYGDLANASAATTFSGSRATYLASLAQARAGNSDAASRLTSDAEAYASAGRSYFGSSAEYTAIVDQIRRDLQERQDSINAASGGIDSGGGETQRLIAQMRAMQEEAMNENRQLREQVSALVAQLQRRA